jgi:hypothetical protein
MELFTDEELASYLAIALADLDEARAGLLRSLTAAAVTPLVPEALLTDARVKGLALEVTARAYRNPEGYIDEALDDWRGRLPDDLGRAGVFLTDSERADLARWAAPGAAIRKVRSVVLVADSTRRDPRILPTP